MAWEWVERQELENGKRHSIERFLFVICYLSNSEAPIRTMLRYWHLSNRHTSAHTFDNRAYCANFIFTSKIRECERVCEICEGAYHICCIEMYSVWCKFSHVFCKIVSTLAGADAHTECAENF